MNELLLGTTFPHEADIGIIGRGKTVEQAFESAAGVVFGIMCDNLSVVQPIEKITVTFEETDIALALVTWLNQLLGEAISRGWVLSKFQVRREEARWIGKAWGEPWRDKFQRGTEVKGATLTMLSVKQQGKIWEAQCIVDV